MCVMVHNHLQVKQNIPQIKDFVQWLSTVTLAAQGHGLIIFFDNLMVKSFRNFYLFCKVP